MKCCINCFDDQELTGFFISNSTEKGDCDFCNSENVELLDPREFEEKFLQLIQIYEIVEEPIREDIQPALLHEKLQVEWSIFKSDLDNAIQNELLKAILTDKYERENPLFSEPVERKIVLFNLEKADELEQEWDQFAAEIKLNNRYFLGKSIDLDLLEDLLKFHVKSYKEGKLYYRARISDQKGFSLESMGKPPAKSSSSGRANPIGIPYLYVSTDPETVIYECRATYLDYVTVAEFRLKDNLKVVRLRQIENLSPFVHEERIEDYLKYQKYLKRLEIELSKPLRRHDYKLEYLPTQYLCEYVKYLGYDAIEYGSSLHDGGINLAVFNDEKLEARKVEIHEVVSVDLDTEII